MPSPADRNAPCRTSSARGQRVHSLLTVALMLGVLATLAEPAAGAAESITIVSSLPLTGSSAAQCQTMVNGITMAVEQAGGAAGGFTIVYKSFDDASPEAASWDPKVEATNADNAIADPDVMAYIGTYNSGAAKISMPKLNLASLVMISPANTASGLTKPGLGEKNEPQVYRPSGKVTYFRVVPADDMQGLAGARWALAMGVTSAYVLNDREVYGIGVAASFRDHAKALGITILGFDGIDGKAANYRSTVSRMRNLHPDLVYFGGITQNNGGQIAKDMVNGGLKAKLMVPDGCYEKAFIDAAGEHTLDGRCFVTFGGLPPDQLTGKGKLFVDAYRARFGAEPEAYAAYAYEAANVVLAAIRRVHAKDRAAICAAVAATRDYDGALGHWSFDANGDTSLTTFSGIGVADDRFVFLAALTAPSP